jgi:molecular chaperone DnaJ
MPQDYYLVLGIAENASQTDIKGAYRRLAKAFHPDHYKGSPRQFQIIQEAYAVLSDPVRRRQHDLQVHDRKSARPRGSFSGPLEPLVPDPPDQRFYQDPAPRAFHPDRRFATPVSPLLFSRVGPATPPRPGRLRTIVRHGQKYNPQTGDFGKTGGFWDFLQNIF